MNVPEHRPLTALADELEIPKRSFVPYGRDMAKVRLDAAELTFHPVAPPEQADMARLFGRLRRRTLGLVRRRRLLEADDHEGDPNYAPDADAQLPLACANVLPSAKRAGRARP